MKTVNSKCDDIEAHQSRWIYLIVEIVDSESEG